MDKIKSYDAKEDWINRKWRPHMAYVYMSICIFDFILGPILNYAFFSHTGATFNEWKPLTLTEGGLFHMAMGAIIGVAAFTRGQEKIKRYDRANRDDGSYNERQNYRQD